MLLNLPGRAKSGRQLGADFTRLPWVLGRRLSGKEGAYIYIYVFMKLNGHNEKTKKNK